MGLNCLNIVIPQVFCYPVLSFKNLLFIRSDVVLHILLSGSSILAFLEYFVFASLLRLLLCLRTLAIFSHWILERWCPPFSFSENWNANFCHLLPQLFSWIRICLGGISCLLLSDLSCCSFSLEPLGYLLWFMSCMLPNAVLHTRYAFWMLPYIYSCPFLIFSVLESSQLYPRKRGANNSYWSGITFVPLRISFNSFYES